MENKSLDQIIKTLKCYELNDEDLNTVSGGLNQPGDKYGGKVDCSNPDCFVHFEGTGNYGEFLLAQSYNGKTCPACGKGTLTVETYKL